MINNKFDICILGNGPTARLCSSFVKDISHVVIGSQNDFGSLSITNIDNNQVNLIPIFPCYNSNLYNALWKEDNTKHEFLNSIKQGNALFEFDKIKELINKANVDSYAVKCFKKNQDIGTKESIVLSYKLWGDIIFHCECNRPYNKTHRQYHKNASNKRLAYVNNLSPYYEKIANIKINNFICENIEKIDIDKKQIITKTFDIKYDKLVSTIHLKEFINKIETTSSLPLDISLISRPACFCFIKSKNKLPVNSVFYDIEIESPIYRIFTIGPNHLIVQFSFGQQEVESDSLFPAIYQLLGHSFEVEFEYRYTLNEAYPIETSSDTTLEKFKRKLESKDIYLIGRYAEWEYLDLHELNYSKIAKI